MVEISNEYSHPLMGANTSFESKLINVDSFAVQFLKRIYAVFPILAMSFSTITQVLQVSKSIASQSSSDSHYDQYVGVISNGYNDYYKCQYGDASAVVVYCPYVDNRSFEIVLGLWVSYFTIFLVVRLGVLFPYCTYDLRFYIAHDLFNAHLINRIMIFLGYLLTLISIVIGLNAMTLNTPWNNTTDTDSMINLILFTGINIVALRKLTNKCAIAKMSNGQEMKTSVSDFPDPVYISCAVSDSPDSLYKKLFMQQLFELKSNDVVSSSRHLVTSDNLAFIMKTLFGM